MTANRIVPALLAAAALATGVVGCSTGLTAADARSALSAARSAAASIDKSANPPTHGPQIFDEAQTARWMHLESDRHYAKRTGSDVWSDGTWHWRGPHGLTGSVAIANSASAVAAYDLRASGGPKDQYFVDNPARTLGVKLLGGEDHGNDVEALAALQVQVNQLPPK